MGAQIIQISLWKCERTPTARDHFFLGLCMLERDVQIISRGITLSPFQRNLLRFRGKRKHTRARSHAPRGDGVKCGGSGTDRISLFSASLRFLPKVPPSNTPFFFFLITKMEGMEGKIERGSERESERDEKASELERHVLDRRTTLHP